MKNLILFVCLLPVFCAAQPGYISTIAGIGTSGFTADGALATAAQLGTAYSSAVDNSGNIFIIDNGRVRKISSSGIITTIAGGGASSADGIPATNATIMGIGGIAFDAYGNLYVAESTRVRKIVIPTGIITTIAGGFSGGFGGDGGPATAALFDIIRGIYFDAGGNLFLSDENNARVRKINTAGIVVTVAGNGIDGYSGDGGPATAAKLNSPDGLCVDAAGNLYIADEDNNRIRKVTPAGIISTFAGTGSGTSSGDGGPATAAGFKETSGICMDHFGNFYISELSGSRIRKVDPSSGIITAFAGGGTSSASGIPATSASFSWVRGMCVDGYNNLYFADQYHYRYCKVNGVGIAAAASDSFSVYINHQCPGPDITVISVNYSASLSVRTWFGDGIDQVNSFTPTTGLAYFNHAYNAAGTYTVKHVLYSGASAVDSVSYSYTYQFCRILPLRLYADANSNCVFESGSEGLINHPSTVEIDSNGIAIDTMILMSGIDYNATGSIGSIYKFKVLSTVFGLTATCPSTGIIADTLITGSVPAKYMAFECSTTPGFDLKETVFAQSGKHEHQGHLVVNNTYCTPQSAVLTVNFSPKYIYQSASPAPTSVVGHTITWNLGTLSALDAAPKNIHYTLGVPAADLLPGDTVNFSDFVNPISGDMAPGNNSIVFTDTVRSSYDPNEIVVSPAGCIGGGTTLTYTTHFENTGNDTAQNIYVLDTLPNTLDIRTLAMVTSSHSVILSKTFNGNNWVLKFNFPNIKLLDSSYHNQCTGLFAYTIKALSTLAVGAVVPNKAGIYFDDNAVVMTNTAVASVCIPAAINNIAAKEEILLYPNPVTNMLHVDKVAAATTYRIINIIGRTMQQGTLLRGSNVIALQSFTQGMYIIELIGADGSRTVKKVVKE